MNGHKHKAIKKQTKHAKHTTHHRTKHAIKTQPKTTALIIGGAILLGVIFVMMNYSIISMDNNYSNIAATKTSSITVEEKKRIEQWIIDDNLNVYGDKKGTIYIGGTPLFNEATGKYQDLYDYILKQHPERPWNN